MKWIKGGCLCGKVRFEGEVEVAFTANCHCTECRRATGAAFGTLIFVEGDLNVTGNLGEYQHHSDRGSLLTKLFCPACGSQVLSRNDARPNLIGVRVGALDDASWVEPQRDVYCSSAIPSTPMDPDLPKFDKMPG